MGHITLDNLTIKTFHEGLTSKKFSALEVTQEHFRSIKEKDADIGAYLSLAEKSAAKEAEAVDIALAKGETLGPLAGVPLAIKDVILIKGQPATAGSKILEHYTASYDAGVTERLKKEKVVFLGKTNLDEFAMGASNENSGFKPVHNPHDLERVPGGSSGGSAAAVAAHMAVAALGTDTGGSIRQPAAFCGVVGLRTTYGSVSRRGVIALASSLDQVGPITKTVADAAVLFRSIAGHDEMDSTSTETHYGDELLDPKLEDVRKLTVGIPKEYFTEGLDPQVAEGVKLAIKTIESLGLTTKHISLPHTAYGVACYYIILPAEASANLARYDGIRYARIKEHAPDVKSLRDIYEKQRGGGFGDEVKRRIILGTFVLSSGYYDAYYDKAQRVRALIKQDFDDAFKGVDVILAPVTPTPPFKLGEKARDPLAMYLADIFTIPVNLAGLPSLALPVKGTAGKLPIGFQLIGRHFREADILGIGQFYEWL